MKRAAVGALVASLLVGATAMAGQGFRGATDHRDPPHSAQNDHRDSRRDDHGRDHNFHARPPAPRYVYRPAPSRFGVYHPPRGYYPHSWRRGERLPVAYYSRPYVIADYRGCGLRAPPRGYHWVRVNHDAVLAAVATGVVLEAVFHLF